MISTDEMKADAALAEEVGTRSLRNMVQRINNGEGEQVLRDFREAQAVIGRLLKKYEMEMDNETTVTHDQG